MTFDKPPQNNKENTPNKTEAEKMKEGVDFILEQNPDLANAAYEALGFKSKDFVYTSELINEILAKPDFEELLPIAQIFKTREFIDKTKVFMSLVNHTNNAFGQSTSFIENNRIAGNVSLFDKKHYKTVNSAVVDGVSQQETLLHEEIHRYTGFIIGEYVKLCKFPGVDYYKKFKEHFNSFGIDVSSEVEFLKEYFNLHEIYRHQGGWLPAAEFITYGLTNVGGIKFLKEIRLHDSDLPERIKKSLSSGSNHITLYDALLDSFKNYYVNISNNTYAATTDTMKLKFDTVLVSGEQKEQAEKIYSEYLKTLPSDVTATKEGFIDFIKKNNPDPRG